MSFLDNGELHLKWAVDIIGGGDVGSFSGLPEALQCWWLHVDDVGLQFVSPDCLNGLTQRQTRGFRGDGVIPNDRFKMIFAISLLWNHYQKGLPWQHLCLVLTFGSISMTQIIPLFRTSFTDSILVPYRFPLYSPCSRNLPKTFFFQPVIWRRISWNMALVLYFSLVESNEASNT